MVNFVWLFIPASFQVDLKELQRATAAKDVSISYRIGI